MSKLEWENIGNYVRERLGVMRVAQVLNQDKAFSLGPDHLEHRCMLYDTERKECSVYEARPLVCRLLGFVEWMPCPIGRPLPLLADGREVMLDYAQLGLRPLSEWLRIAPIESQPSYAPAWEAVG
jgi:hypothetical protein